MTRGEATNLGLHFLGAIGCAASVTMVLIGIERGDREDFVAAAVLFAVGVVTLLVSGLETKDEGPRT